MKARSKMPGALIAAWAVLIAAVFFASTGPMVAATSGFFRTAVLLLLTGYLALFAGFRILRALEGRLETGRGGWDPLERTTMEFGLGIGVLIGAVFVMGLLGLYREPAAYGLLLVLLVGPHRRFLRDLRDRFSREATAGRSGNLFLLLAIALVGTMTFLQGMAPTTAQDSLVYHLAVPSKYIEAGGIRYIPESFFAQFPGNVEMLFTLALLLRGSPLAGGYHWLLGAAATLAVAALARRLARAGSAEGGDTPRSGLLAAAIFATVPTVAALAGCAYIDLGLVLFELLSSLAFLRWWELGAPAAAPTGDVPQGRRSWLVLSGVFAGLAAGSKYTGGAQGLLIAFAALLEGRQRRRRTLEAVGSSALACAVTAALASPWWLKSLIYTGNPLFPFLYGIFGGKEWDGERAEVLAQFLNNWGGASGGILDLLLLPFKLTLSARFFSIERFDGMIGPAFLIGAPVILLAILRRGLRDREAGARFGSGAGGLLAVAFGLSLAHGLLWLGMSRQIRFLLPSIALWAVLIEASLPIALEPGRWRAVTALSLRLGAAFNALVIATNFAAHNPVPVVLGMEPESKYLERELPGGDYAVFESIERELPRKSFVLFGALGNPGFLCKRPYHADALFENRTLSAILRAGRDPEGVREEFCRRGFTHLLFRWDLVFDASEKRSDITLEDQKLLGEFLNRHGRMLAKAGGTFLYEIASP